jgi:hypothetical protein
MLVKKIEEEYLKLELVIDEMSEQFLMVHGSPTVVLTYYHWLTGASTTGDGGGSY